jgi:hypothetical protein
MQCKFIAIQLITSGSDFKLPRTVYISKRMEKEKFCFFLCCDIMD